MVKELKSLLSTSRVLLSPQALMPTNSCYDKKGCGFGLDSRFSSFSLPSISFDCWIDEGGCHNPLPPVDQKAIEEAYRTWVKSHENLILSELSAMLFEKAKGMKASAIAELENEMKEISDAV